MADCIVVIVSLVSSTQEKAAMHYTITSIALLLLCGAVIYPNEGLVFPRGMPAVLKELNVLDPFKYPFSVAVIDQFYDAEFDVLEICFTITGDIAGALGPDADDSIWTDASEICAPKVPGSFILEWLFGIDANQKVFFGLWVFVFSCFCTFLFSWWQNWPFWRSAIGGSHLQ